MIHDFRFALRQLGKAKGFTAAAVIVLALGIGANTAIFGILNTLLFQPPAYDKPGELVQVFSQDKKNPDKFRGFSYATFLDVREQNSVLSGVMAHNLSMVGLDEGGRTRRTFADIVTRDYFSVLGVAPAQGRAFLPEEETPGTNPPVAIVSHSYWEKQALNPALLGSTITINSRPYTIVGILPKGFTGTMRIFAPEVWLPMGSYDQVGMDFESAKRGSIASRSRTELLVIGRLKPGVTAVTAAAALKTLAANLEQAYPVEQKDQTLITAPLSRFATSTRPNNDNQVKMLAPLLLGMAAVVLLVACLNLANMLLARGTARRKEIAIRLALGGSRWRIVRQLLIEGFLLALLGGVGGLVLGLWSSDLLVASMMRLMPVDIVWENSPNLSLVSATLGFCVLGTLVFALGPALKLSKSAVIEDLKEHAGEDVVRRSWRFLPRNPLVVVQIAFSLALLTAAALFIRGAGKAASVDTGLQTDNNFLLEVDAGLAGYDQARARNLYRTLEERLAALPGIERVSIASTVPFGLVSLNKPVQRGGVNAAPDSTPATAADGLAYPADWNSVGAEYFSAVGIPLLRGRAFSAAEAMHEAAPKVAIIDEVLAKKLWPDGDALGQQIQFATKDAPRERGDGGSAAGGSGEPADEATSQMEVIGIVPYARTNLFEKNPPGAVYVPFAGGFQNNVFYHLRFAPGAASDTSTATNLIRRTVREVDTALPVLSLKSFAQHLEGDLQLWVIRVGAALFTVFGVVALALAAVGLYGVKAYSVARRTREIGIRMALGAQRKTVLWMILREGSLMLASGLAVGFLLAAALGRLLSGLLYQVGALDPLAFTISPLVLAAAALLATWVPARRATQVDPMTALRTE
jgi:predicted permease